MRAVDKADRAEAHSGHAFACGPFRLHPALRRRERLTRERTDPMLSATRRYGSGSRFSRKGPRCRIRARSLHGPWIY
jgi:hypothetical protein